MNSLILRDKLGRNSKLSNPLERGMQLEYSVSQPGMSSWPLGTQASARYPVGSLLKIRISRAEPCNCERLSHKTGP